MAEIVNTNVFDANKKFVDFAGLDYFWEKAKAYVDAADKVLSDRLDTAESDIDTLQATVGDDNNGLVKAVAQLRTDVDALGGEEGGIQGMIDATIAGLDVEDAAVDGKYVSSVAEVDGKVVVSREDLPDWTDAIATAKGEAISESNSYADGLDEAMDARVKVLEEIDHQKIVDDAINDFATKVSNDEVVNTYKELIDYAATHSSEFTELVGEVAKKAEKTYVDGLDEAMDVRVKALEDHKDDYVGADTALETALKAYADQAEADAVTSANAYTDAEVKEAKEALEAVIEENENVTSNALTDLNTRVEDLEAHKEDYVAADATLKSDLEKYADQAETDANAYTDALYASIKFATTGDIDTLFATEQ